jgi:YD repeat-containing protein
MPRSETRTNARGQKTQYDFDDEDNVTQQTLSDGSTLSYQYHPFYAYITQKTDERGRGSLANINTPPKAT